MLTAIILLCAPIVVDGDTLRDCEGVRWRLARIDAPEFERSSPCRRRPRRAVCDDRLAQASADNLRRLIAGRPVRCLVVDADPSRPGFQATDRYGRPVARCQAGGRDLSEAQLSGSFAVRWPRPAR